MNVRDGELKCRRENISDSQGLLLECGIQVGRNYILKMTFDLYGMEQLKKIIFTTIKRLDLIGSGDIYSLVTLAMVCEPHTCYTLLVQH